MLIPVKNVGFIHPVRRHVRHLLKVLLIINYIDILVRVSLASTLFKYANPSDFVEHGNLEHN